MEIGKVPNELLEKLVFKNITYKREEVLARPGIGEDTGVMDFGNDLCVVSTDPITGATTGIGTLAIHVSCNDAATRGAEPVGILMTILCPPGTTEEELEQVMIDAGKAASEEKVEIIGGHSEITDAVTRIVVSTTVIAKLSRENFKDYDDIKVGDKIVMTKWMGLEGTHILAHDIEERLAECLSAEELDEAQSYGKYLSVVKDGLIGRKNGVVYMHDITEGGVFGAVWEAGEAVGKGILLYEDNLPIKEVTQKICDCISIDPKKLISSGSMIMIVNEDNLASLVEELELEGIKATVIGEVTENGIKVRTNGEITPILPPGSDELYTALNA